MENPSDFVTLANLAEHRKGVDFKDWMHRLYPRITTDQERILITLLLNALGGYLPTNTKCTTPSSLPRIPMFMVDSKIGLMHHYHLMTKKELAGCNVADFAFLNENGGGGVLFE
eukprot:CAMPEP_0201481508 /NCGR_PEP_ID=MMETSP0151_2-20130828/5785_1 /ASSEMBLY_ACC=CAM_ASM_000257 /TAXON_ID=200890 /ORGANISM="Paramoeba atlantica, Strain 621/1 / CCAP 1560/9" /LENGTH=113 /DNA_ID=CAMNT_0047863747 /DNA_START=333 /DNA_END=671 /DNA_ORIENTATION=+